MFLNLYNAENFDSFSSAPGSGDSPKVERSGLEELSDVAMFHSDVQPNAAQSPCQTTDNLRRHPCDQLCFALPDDPNAKCGCARGVPKNDGRGCRGIANCSTRAQ